MIKILSTYIIGKIDSESFDLSNLPDFPKIATRHIGYIDYINERTNSGYIISNGYGFESFLNTGNSIEIRFNLKDLTISKNPAKGQLVTFYIKDYSSSQLKALDVNYLNIDSLDFSLIKQYTGSYSQIHGRNYNGRVYTKSIIEDSLLMYLKEEEGVSILLKELSADESFIKWLPQDNPDLLLKLFSIMDAQCNNEEINTFVTKLRKNSIANAIKLMQEDVQHQFISHLSEDFAIDLINTYFMGTPLFDIYIGEKWNSCKAEMPYRRQTL